MPFTSAAGSSPATVTAALCATGPVALTSLDASNKNAAERYIQIFDKATAPIAGDVPIAAYPIPPLANSASGRFFRDYGQGFDVGGLLLKNGLAWGVSTTAATYTAATATDHTVVATWTQEVNRA